MPTIPGNNHPWRRLITIQVIDSAVRRGEVAGLTRDEILKSLPEIREAQRQGRMVASREFAELEAEALQIATLEYAEKLLRGPGLPKRLETSDNPERTLTDEYE